MVNNSWTEFWIRIYEVGNKNVTRNSHVKQGRKCDLKYTLHTVDNIWMYLVAKVNNGTLRNITGYKSNISLTNHKNRSAIHRKSTDNNGVPLTYHTEHHKTWYTAQPPILYDQNVNSAKFNFLLFVIYSNYDFASKAIVKFNDFKEPFQINALQLIPF